MPPISVRDNDNDRWNGKAKSKKRKEDRGDASYIEIGKLNDKLNLELALS